MNLLCFWEFAEDTIIVVFSFQINRCLFLRARFIHVSPNRSRGSRRRPAVMLFFVSQAKKQPPDHESWRLLLCLYGVSPDVPGRRHGCAGSVPGIHRNIRQYQHSLLNLCGHLYSTSANLSMASRRTLRGQATLTRWKPSPALPKIAPLSSQSRAFRMISSSSSAVFSPVPLKSSQIR